MYFSYVSPEGSSENEGCSVVDYFVIASKLFPFVSSFEVGQRTESVHFPLELCADLPLKHITNTAHVNNAGKDFPKYKWSESYKNTFLEILPKFSQELKTI